MGRSDPYLKSFYMSMLEGEEYETIGLFGQAEDNFVSSEIKSSKRYFYDMSLKNWNINAFPYNVEEKFDLIVCTRCAYFSNNPEKMLEEFSQMLNPRGTILIDWALGDHWRFEDYKVGWIKNNEQEYAYGQDNFLWSTVWHDSFLENDEYKFFENWVKRYGYEDVRTAIKDEVPVILNLSEYENAEFGIKALWPKRPQLYILCKFRKST